MTKPYQRLRDDNDRVKFGRVPVDPDSLTAVLDLLIDAVEALGGGCAMDECDDAPIDCASCAVIVRARQIGVIE